MLLVSELPRSSLYCNDPFGVHALGSHSPQYLVSALIVPLHRLRYCVWGCEIGGGDGTVAEGTEREERKGID